MKYVVALAILLLARVGMATALPADTLEGQARFVQHLSSSMCQHLSTELQGKEISQLTASEGQALLSKVTYQAMADNSDEFERLSAHNGLSASNLSGQVGQLAAINLIQTCPAGNALLVRMAMLSSGLEKGIDPAERALLQPVVQTICQRLELAYAAPASSSSVPRGQLLQTELRKAILARRTEFIQYYGEDVLGDNKAAEQVGHKIGILMLGQCPHYLMLATQDEQAARQMAPAPPRAALKSARPVPKATKPPARRAAGK